MSNATSTGNATVGAAARPIVSDKLLIERIATGDKAAMQDLWARHYTRVYRFAARIVKNAALAEDLTSDTFLETWRHAGRFEGRCAVSTWLLTIVRNKAMATMRRRQADELDAEHYEIADPGRGPEAALESKDIGSVMRRCLASLTRKQSQIIELIYYHDKSLVEVAKFLGIPEGTVRTRAFHARLRLGERLEQAGIDRRALAALTCGA